MLHSLYFDCAGAYACNNYCVVSFCLIGTIYKKNFLQQAPTYSRYRRNTTFCLFIVKKLTAFHPQTVIDQESAWQINCLALNTSFLT